MNNKSLQLFVLLVVFAFYQGSASSDLTITSNELEVSLVACEDRNRIDNCVRRIQKMDIIRNREMFSVTGEELKDLCSEMKDTQKCLEDMELCLSPEAVACTNLAPNCYSYGKSERKCAASRIFHPCHRNEYRVCSKNNTFKECMTEVSDRCRLNRRKQITLDIPEYSWTGKTLDEMRTIVNLVKGHCVGKEVNENFLINRKCLLKRDSFAEFNVKTSMVSGDEFEKLNATQRQDACCEFVTRHWCAIDTYTNICGAEAGNFVIEYFKIATDVIRTKCQCSADMIAKCTPLCNSSTVGFGISWFLLLVAFFFKSFL